MMSDETQKRSTDCVYFLASPLTCKKGNDCEYRHSENARMNPRDCWYWLGGNCFNAARCPFRHPPLDGRTPAATANTTATIAATPSSTGPTNNSTTTTSVAPAIQKPTGVTTVSTYPPPIKSKLVSCYYFAQGFCSRGDTCAFLHGSLPPNPTPNNNNTTEAAPQKSTQIASKPSVNTTNGKQLGLTGQSQKSSQVASKASVVTTTTNWKHLGLTGQSQKSTQVASKNSVDTTTVTNGKLGSIGQSQKSTQVAGKSSMDTTITANGKQLGLIGQSQKVPEVKKPVFWNAALPKVVPGGGATLEAVLIPKKVIKSCPNPPRCLNLPINVDEMRLNEQVDLGLWYKRERDGMPRNGTKVAVDRIPNGGVHSRGESSSSGYGDADEEERELRVEYEYPSMVLARGVPTRGDFHRRDVYEELLEAPSDYAVQKRDTRPLSDLRNHITKRQKIEGTTPSPPLPHLPHHHHHIHLQDNNSRGRSGHKDDNSRHKDDNSRHVGEISVRDRLGSPNRQGLLLSHGIRTAPLRSKRSYYDGVGFDWNNASPDRNPKKIVPPRNPTKEQSTPYLTDNKIKVSGSNSVDFSPPKSLAQIKAEKMVDGKGHSTTMKSQIFLTCKEENTTGDEAKKIKSSNSILKEKGKPLLEVEAISNKGSLDNAGSLVEKVVEEGEFFRRSNPHNGQVQAKNRLNNGENGKVDASEYKENINGVEEGGKHGCLGMGSSDHRDEFDVGYNDNYALEDDNNDEFARKISQFFS